MNNKKQRYRIVYCTTNKFKKEELKFIANERKVYFPSSDPISEVKINEIFEFEFRNVEVTEILECDLTKMVYQKTIRAYETLMVPCIVEHAGLVFSEYREESYPGGLTQPMWDTLKAEGFLRVTGGGGRRVVARAVIGFCNGKKIQTFTGETDGVLADAPRGSRKFYWDPVFCPNNEDGTPGKFTYAEIADDPNNGLARKAHFSQSGKALQKFLQSILDNEEVEMFRTAR